MTETELEDFFQRCPQLFHMAMPGSWDLIAEVGLLCTEKLLTLFKIEDAARKQLTGSRRPESVEIKSSEYGNAVIRDQIPLLDSDLEACLQDGLTPDDWHKILNERVFLWTNPRRLNTLLNARAYRSMSHDVLTLDTRRVFADYHDQIELTPMNSGCTRPWRHPRGKDTFLPIADYPYSKRIKRSQKDDAIVEVTVLDGIQPIVPYVETVHRMKANEIEFVIYTR